MASPQSASRLRLHRPDIYAERLPVDELAELRKSAPIRWNDVPGRLRRLR